jgi:hypothetical protein
MLAQLAMDGHLVERAGKACHGTPPDGTSQAMVSLWAMAGEHGASWKSLLRHGYKETFRQVEHELHAEGTIVRTESRILGLVPRIHVTAVDAEAVLAVQDRACGVLRGHTPVEQVDVADAALVALAAAVRVPSVLSIGDGRRYDERIAALTERIGALAPGLCRAVKGLHRTMIAARSGGGSH